MAKARQQYFADEVTLQKESREFAIEPELVEKLDSIETGAQVNVIETVKVNGEALVPDEDKAVDIDVPLVEDDLYGTDNDAALSARQGRVLYDYIQNIQSRGRYLSNWNCATGLAMTNPSDNPYDYRAGDYYVVSNVSSGTNYRPDGAQYIINQASTTVELEIVKVSDSYIYDGTTWILLVNTEREIAVDSSLSTTSTNPVENRVVTNALNTKQDILIAGTNIQIAADGKTISATDTTYSSLPAAEGGVDVSLVTTGEKYTWNGKQDKLIAGNNISIAADGKTISAVDTTYSNLPAAQGGTDVSLVSTGDKYIWNNKQDTLIAGANIQIAADGKTVSATDTTYTAGTNVSIDANNVISATDTTYTAGANISIDANNEISAVDTTYSSLPAASGGTDVSLVTTGEKYIWDNKQDELIAGTNIQIAADGKTISATDTTYVAGDFDIKDLADSTGLRTEWSGKQDALIAGTNIQIAADGKTISATDTTYTAGANISISNNNVISATDSKAVWGGVSGTLADQTDLNTALGGKQDTLIAGTNIQIAADGKTISATDTTYTAGTGISIDANNVISNTQTSAAWGNITGTLSDQTDLNTALGGKQDTLIAGTNIQIAADGKTISATDTTYTAGTGIDITNGVISNTQTSAEWGNITGTLADQSDLKTELDKKMENLVFLSYGISTWADFEAAYGKNVYCRASSNSNPAQGDQTRCAFMAYINNPNISSATEVEFQYYRSVATHSDSTQGDEVFVYKLNKTTGRSVTKRNAYTKIAAGTNMSSSYSNGTLTLSATDTTYNTATSSTAGIVKLGSDTLQTEAAQSASSTAGRTYPVQLNSSDQMVVNVPWEDTQTGSATSSAAGTVKLFSDTVQTETAQSVSSTANRTYGIQNNSSNQMVVNVPWTDTTYSNGTYLTLNGTTFDVDTSLIATKSDLANFAGFQVVATLPTSDIKTNIIYLLGPFTSVAGGDKYEEWIYSNNNWIMIGETSVDLSPYFNYTTQTSDAITEGSTNLFLTSAERTILGNTSNTNTGDETKTTIQTKLGAASASNSGYLTSTDWSTFNGKANAADVNTKTFYLSSTSDLTNAQAAYDWYKAGKNPIISLMPLGVNYTVQALSTNYLAFVSGTNSNGISAGGSYSYINDYTLLLNKSGDTITSVSLSSVMGWNSDVHYLDTNVDYADPYVPQYNGSPATKKYVDDSIPTYTAGSNVTIEEVCESDMRGPAPSGFHVPLTTEWQAVYDVWTALGGGSSDGTNFGIALKLPCAGSRRSYDSSVYGQGSQGFYWSSSPYPSDADYSYHLAFFSTNIRPQYNSYRALGYSVRCFKNTPTIPTSSWTKLYGTSIEAGGIFWSSTDGLISLSSDGQTWITIQDKNLGATTVWNSGDTVSETNGGKYYQWGNNYGFAWTGSLTTSGTQVDASVYGPGNYYSSSTFITGNNDRSSVQNDNLRGGISQGTQCGNMISATDTTYENKTAASGGTDVSLVTTGEKYTWNNKANASDITVKAYTTDGTMDIQTFMAIVNGLAINGIAPIIIYNTEPYYYERAVNDTSTLTLYFYAPSNGVSSGTLYNKRLTASLSMSTYEVTITQSNENLALGSGDMSYSDFGRQAKTGATITLDLASTYTPSANFTVNAPSTIKDGQTYILRVNNGATAYTMTLGTNVTNPFDTDITLTANGVDQFVFLAIGGALELQPEGGGGGGGGGIAPAANSPINVKYIWAGTQAQYEALSSYDDNTVYLTV